MTQKSVEPKEMTDIGYVTVGHSEFNDDVWKTLGEIDKESQLRDICDSIDYWALLPVLALAGATIEGNFREKITDGEILEGYNISIPASLSIKEFCRRMKKVSPDNY